MIFFIFIANCHLCPGSSYSATCFDCITTNNLCTITCECETANSTNTTSTIDLQPGFNNGCELENIDGNLTCGSIVC